jgi:hypothetical protein
MAYLTQEEFTRAMSLLADDLGLQRLRDRFVRFNALVTRRRAASAQQLADQLYMLSGALRRQVPATIAFHTIWTQQVNEKLGEEGEKDLEAIADKVNGCLGDDEKIVAGKEDELEAALVEYMQRLAGAIGNERARIDMLLKAVPDVCLKLRAMPDPPAEKSE